MKIARMNKGDWGKTIAFFDIMTDEGFVIKGFKLIDGSKGIFVGNPSQQGKDGNWYDIVYPSGDVLRDNLRHLAKEAYGTDHLPDETTPKYNDLEPPPLSDEDVPF